MPQTTENEANSRQTSKSIHQNSMRIGCGGEPCETLWVAVPGLGSPHGARLHLIVSIWMCVPACLYVVCLYGCLSVCLCVCLCVFVPVPVSVSL